MNWPTTEQRQRATELAQQYGLQTRLCLQIVTLNLTDQQEHACCYMASIDEYEGMALAQDYVETRKWQEAKEIEMSECAMCATVVSTATLNHDDICEGCQMVIWREHLPIETMRLEK